MKQVSAVVHLGVLEQIEERLHDLNVPTISARPVRAVGASLGAFARGGPGNHARIYATHSFAASIVLVVLAGMFLGAASTPRRGGRRTMSSPAKGKRSSR